MPKMVHANSKLEGREIDAHPLQVPVFQASGWLLSDEPAADIVSGAKQPGTDSSAGASDAGGQQKPTPASRQKNKES